MKERNFRRQWIRRSSAALLLGTVGLTTPRFALSQATHYAPGRRQIKACVLVTSGIQGANNGKQNPNPHLWYLMEQREDIKPAGWEFVNPLAATAVTGETYQRWKNRGGTTDPAFIANTPQSQIFAIGAQLSKNMAPYWEVDLDTVTDDELRQFDVAFIGVRGNGGGTGAYFSQVTRQRLQRFVDGGGTLWLEFEDRNVLLDDGQPFIVPLTPGAKSGRVRSTIAAPRHPILQSPYPFSQFDIGQVGRVAGAIGGHETHTSQSPALYPVLWAGRGNNVLPYVSAGDYGAGHIVVSSAGIATGITAFVGANGPEGRNSNVLCGSNLQGIQPADLKIAYNIVSFGSNAPTTGTNSRRTGYTPDDVGSLLGPKWTTLPANTNLNDPTTPKGTGAVVSKGLVYTVQSYNGAGLFLRAFDLNPGTDLDNDGNPDDGIPDFQYDSPYDEVWRSALQGAGYSTPTVLTTYDGTAKQTLDRVLVTSAAGQTLAFYGLTYDASGKIVTAPTSVWSYPASAPSANLITSLNTDPALLATSSIPSPATSEGVIFAVTYDDTQVINSGLGWRIVALDPGGANVFRKVTGMMPPRGDAVTGSTLMVDGMPAPLGSLAVGYTRDPATNALYKIVSVATRPPIVPGSIDPQKSTGAVYSAWFSTKGEPLTADTGDPNFRRWIPIGSGANVPWYTDNSRSDPNSSNYNPLNPVLHVYKTIGGVTTQTTIKYSAAAGSSFDVQYSSGKTTISLDAPVNSSTVIYADYTLDWSGDSVGRSTNNYPPLTNLSTIIRTTSVQPLNATSTPMSVATGGVAFSDQDTLVFANDFLNTGGMFDTVPPARTFAYKNFTNFTNSTPPIPVPPKATWMFAPYSQADAPAVTDYPIPTRLTYSDNDFLTTKGTEPLTQFHAVGTPAIANGIVYTLGTALINGGRPATVLLALRSDPNLTFTIPGLAVGADSAVTPGVAIRQPNMLATDPVAPGSVITLTQNTDYTIDPSTGAVTLINLSTGTGAINLGLPLQYRITTSGANNPNFSLLVDGKTGLSPLDNLLWYMVIPQRIPAGTQQGTRVTDLDKQLTESGAFPNTIANYGVPASGPSLSGDTLSFGTTDGRIASLDLSNLQATGNAVSLYNGEHLRLRLTRVLQNPDGSPVIQPIRTPPLANATSLVVGAPLGVAALDNRLTLIADGSRLLEVDYDGNAVSSIATLSSSDLIGAAANAQTATSRVSLSRPTVARRGRRNDYVIADTGNNRIVRGDISGFSSYELRTFSDDLRITNGTTSLLAPTDVQATEQRGGDNATFSITNPLTGEIYSHTGDYSAVRYLIADSGNFRLVEVVDAYDEDGAPLVLTNTNPMGGPATITMQHQAVWTTRSLSTQNQRLRYRTVQQYTDDNGLFVIAAVDNVNAAVTDIGGVAFGANGNSIPTEGGSLVALRRYPQGTTPPAPAKDGDVSAVVSSLVFTDASGVNVVRRQPLNKPTYFRQYTTRNNGNAESRYLVCDLSGVYLLRPNGNEAYVLWALTSEDYFRMTGRKLIATSVQKLPQSDYDKDNNLFRPRFLITNQYSGSDGLNQFFKIFPAANTLASPITDSEMRGEVFEVRSLDYYTANGYQNPAARLYSVGADPNNIGQLILNDKTSAIRWTAPKETVITVRNPNTNAIIRQYIKRQIGSTDTSTFTFSLEQPAFSERQN